MEYVEPRTKMVPKNAYIRSIVQMGKSDMPDSALPYYKRNIRGNDEIIGTYPSSSPSPYSYSYSCHVMLGLGDSGIDVNNCFMYDPDHSGMF